MLQKIQNAFLFCTVGAGASTGMAIVSSMCGETALAGIFGGIAVQFGLNAIAVTNREKGTHLPKPPEQSTSQNTKKTLER